MPTSIYLLTNKQVEKGKIFVSLTGKSDDITDFLFSIKNNSEGFFIIKPTVALFRTNKS